jgi:hypothetical protein
MKRFSIVLIVTAIVGILGACTLLKPFTQDELDRLSYDAAPSRQAQ